MTASDHQLGVGSRLHEPPSTALVQSFGQEMAYAPYLYEGLSWADLAHVTMLLETGIAPAEPAKRLLEALVALHDGGLASLRLEARWGDLYNNRDAELGRRLGADAGWLHAGRARREALTIGWLLHLRRAGAELLERTAAVLDSWAAVAERHAETLMPDFTYLQHAHPTTLGHYLLGFAYPVARDAERLDAALRQADASPAGSASTNGSRLPLDRERMRELLGFGGIAVHDRDAMWQSDVPISLMAVLVSLATTASRLAEELQIWATAEFGFVELADRHCRTSVIMPQKKNPYALTFIRGRAREMDGHLVSVVTTNQTPSGQIDNRNTAYELVPRALRDVNAVLTLLGEILETARFDPERLRRQALEGFTGATELTDLLLQREGVDSRRAHEIVGAVAAKVPSQRDEAALAEALAGEFQAAVGRSLKTAAADLVAEIRADRIVAGRAGLGSCAPESVRRMCGEIRERAAARRVAVHERAAMARFPERLREAVSRHLERAW
jgi:argininosuccinate lyase